MKRILLLMVALILCGCGKSSERASQARACIDFASEWSQWSQQLTTDGQKVGKMMADAMNGQTVDRQEFDDELSKFDQKLSEQIEVYKTQSLPEVAELQDYRDLVVDYLEFQRGLPVDAIRKSMDLATNTTMPEQARGMEIVKLITDAENAEKEWKSRLDASVKQLEVWVNMNGL